MNLPDSPAYDRRQSYLANYSAALEPVELDVPPIPGQWKFCGLPVHSPLGIPAGPLLNGKWCLYYASLGFDVLTYKTVRTSQRDCYPVPNLVPVNCGDLTGAEFGLPASGEMDKSWAVSFGMPSAAPKSWRADVEQTKRLLPAGKLLSVSVVGTIQPGWQLQELADDYALAARWAVEAGADAIAVNFSCPNVSTLDGQLCQAPNDAALVAQTVRREIGSIPLVVKIGQIASDRIDPFVAAVGPSVDAFAMTNSVASTVVGTDGRSMFGGQPRGICGDAIRHASISQTAEFRKSVGNQGLDLDLVGIGGIFTAEHVRQYLDAGAAAVQLATAPMLNPMVAVQIKTDLNRFASS